MLDVLSLQNKLLLYIYDDPKLKIIGRYLIKLVILSFPYNPKNTSAWYIKKNLINIDGRCMNLAIESLGISSGLQKSLNFETLTK